MRIWLLLFFCLGLLVVHAQQPSLYFRKLTVENGLSNNKVNCIIQDSRGFTWFGTDDGLNRYDGNRVQIFNTITSGISGNIITDILEGKNGILWITTSDGGLSTYDYRLHPRDQFKQYKHLPGDSNSIPTNVLNSLLEDKNGNIWIATNGYSAIYFDKKAEKFSCPFTFVPNILDLQFDEAGIIWAGRLAGSIMKIDPVSLKFEVDSNYENIYARLPHVVVTSIFRDSRNNMWFGSWDKAVYRYNSSVKKEEMFNGADSPHSFGKDEPLAFNEDRNGMIWIGGKYFGLYLYDPVLNKFYNYRHDPSKEGTLANNKVNCIYIDKKGNSWIGTERGISIYEPSSQQFHQVFLPIVEGSKEKPLTIYAFYKEGKNDLWLGTNYGIFIRNAVTGHFTHRYLSYKNYPLTVTQFFKDVDGSFYIGTDYTLFKYDPAKNHVTTLRNTDKDVVMSKLIESRVVSIQRDTLDGHPSLFVSPYGHFIAIYDLVEQRWISRNDSVKKLIDRFHMTDFLVRKLHKASDGSLWMAYAKGGMSLLNTGDVEEFAAFKNNPNDKQSISNNSVFDIAEDSKSDFWVSTYGGGLNHFDRKQGKFAMVNSLQNLVEGLALDRTGNLWMISNGHLNKYYPDKNVFYRFNLPDIEKTGGVRGYIYKDRDGRFYVAGSNYYISFDPDSIQESSRDLKVIFTDFKIFNQSISNQLFQSTVKLRYNQNFFSFEFTAPDYSSAAPVQYAYMLKGFDKDWIQNGEKNYANYTNLPGGEYVFKVRAAESATNWGNEIASIHVVITPPFWKRWWFFILCAAVIGGAVYAVYRYRLSELLRRQEMRNKIAQDLHDNVGSTLSSISVYSQVARIQSENQDKEKLDKVLEKIGDTSNEMISEMSDIVWAINPRHDDVKQILQRMQSFANPLLAARDIHFRFEFDPRIEHYVLSMEKRKNFYMTFKEAINNAVKYSDANEVKVRIQMPDHHHVRMTIEDDGKGFDTSVHRKGNGIWNIGYRAKEMNGKFDLNSSPGTGTRLMLEFPVP